MADRIEINIKVSTYVFYMEVTTFSGNSHIVCLCSECLAQCKVNKVYRIMTPLPHISKRVMCTRCNTMTPETIKSVYGLSEDDILISLLKGESFDIKESGVTIKFVSFDDRLFSSKKENR